jgi:putative addiction module component (TIGR02574 family)
MGNDAAFSVGVRCWYDNSVIALPDGEPKMSPTLKALGIDQLSVAERILLVEEIWDSIAEEDEEIPLTEAQRLDLQRRVAAYEANPKAGSSWEEVKARLQGNS